MKLCGGLLLVFVLSAIALRAAPYRHDDTGFVFPETLGVWARARAGAFPQREHGISAAYRSSPHHTITAYIYNNGIEGIPDGADNGIVRSEAGEVAEGVEQVWAKEGAKVRALWTRRVIDRTDRVVAVFFAHRIEIGGEILHSLSAVTGFRSHFFKLRYTYRGNAAEEGEKDVAMFMADLLRANAELLGKSYSIEAGSYRLEPVSGASARR